MRSVFCLKLEKVIWCLHTVFEGKLLQLLCNCILFPLYLLTGRKHYHHSQLSVKIDDIFCLAKSPAPYHHLVLCEVLSL